jgi:dTDP-4-amino-4,6-dideoxygalactose transaminase
MSHKPIYVTQPHLPSLDKCYPYLEKIWNSRVLTNGGPIHAELEEKLKYYLGVPEISLFSNGTLALMVALRALKIKGEVITTPYSFIATSHSLLWNDVKPVFVDIEPHTLNIDVTKIESAITSRTTAILPVHCYGNPCDVNGLREIADNYNLKIIYDAAHAFGVELENSSLLSYGDLSVMSFHATKVFNTFEGGAIVCHDKKMKKHIDNLKNFGFVDELHISSIGINAKMSELNAAIGVLQLEEMQYILDKRKKIDQFYRQELSLVEGVECVPLGSQSKSNYSYFPILVKDQYKLSRDQLYVKFREEEIFTRRYFYPLISNFSMYGDNVSSQVINLPVANKISDQVLCLPIYPDLGESDLHRVIDVIKAFR